MKALSIRQPWVWLILNAGKVQAVFKKTKSGHIKAVRHFYPTGEMQ